MTASTITEGMPSSRDEAWSRLQTCLQKLPLYHTKRNRVSSGHPYVSRLSSAIRYRLILESEVIQSVLAKYPLAKVDKFVQEVLWRTYWRGWLERRPQVWQDYRRQVRFWRKRPSSETMARGKAILGGKSGVAIMDRFTNELRQTGYLHNHARRWWASFWIHEARLPWAVGADFFFRHLLDADPASNTLSWRWVAGLQTPGKTYLARASNILRYCGPEYLTDRSGLDRLQDGHLEPATLSDETNLQPIAWHPPSSLSTLPQEKCGLWLHPDDCLLEQGVLSSGKPTSVAAFYCEAIYLRMGLSPLRRQHLRSVLSDGLARASHHFGCEGKLIETDNLEVSMGTWAQSKGLRTVISYAPAVGPVKDGLPNVERSLARQGVHLRLAQRSWDRQLFPLAKKGFFPFWRHARGMLEEQISELSSDSKQVELGISEDQGHMIFSP
jgi:deoxyribodipyrimidine photo-lyase